MTEYELDKIKKSFVRSNAKCPVEVACLLTVIKYYNGKETDIHTLTEWCKINGKLTLAGMKQGAIYSGMKAEICLQNIHQLTQRKLPIILFTLNDTPIRDKIAISCMLRQIHESSSHAIRHGLYIKNRKRLFCP